MSPRDRRLAILAAVLAPRRVGGLLRRLASPDAPEVQAYAEALSKRSRADRLEALLKVLSEDAARRPVCLRSAAGAERPCLAKELLTMARAPEIVVDCPPGLRRLLAERGWGE